MKRTTIFTDDELLVELKMLSREEGRSVAQLVREALREFLLRKKPAVRKISFMGIGKSGKKDIAAKHEELLWKKPLRER